MLLYYNIYEEILKSHPYPIDAMNNIFYLVYAAVSIYTFHKHIMCMG